MDFNKARNGMACNSWNSLFIIYYKMEQVIDNNS